MSSLSPEAVSSDRPNFVAWPDFAQLVVLLRHAQRGAYVFALYHSAPVRDEVVAALPGVLAPLPVYEFTLTERERNPLAYLERLPPAARDQPAVVVIYGLDRINRAGDPNTSWGYLDAQREALNRRPHSLVFWVTPSGAAHATRFARNVWAQRSGVVDFTFGTNG